MFSFMPFTWHLHSARLNDGLGQSASARDIPAAALSMGKR
jgi:hypothetical protein